MVSHNMGLAHGTQELIHDSRLCIITRCESSPDHSCGGLVEEPSRQPVQPGGRGYWRDTRTSWEERHELMSSVVLCVLLPKTNYYDAGEVMWLDSVPSVNGSECNPSIEAWV